MHYTHENRSESDGGGLEAQVEVYGSSYHRVPSLFLQIQASFSHVRECISHLVLQSVAVDDIADDDYSGFDVQGRFN